MQPAAISATDQAREEVLTSLRAADYARDDGVCLAPPKHLILGINNVCNLHCKMCDVGLGDRKTVFWANLIGDDPHNMSLTTMWEILRQAEAFHPKPQIGLAFTEPLLHPQIVEFVHLAVSSGFTCTVTTNGTTLPRFAEDLVEAGLHELTLSVDGPAEIHNRIRGGRDTFQKLYRGAERLNEAKARRGVSCPKLNFSFTIADENYRHMLAFVQEVEPLRPTRIIFSQLNFITEAMAVVHNARYGREFPVVRSNLGTMQPAGFDIGAIAEELERVRAYAEMRGRDFPSLHFSPDTTDPARLARFYQEPLAFFGGRACTDPWRMMMIKTDGVVIPAHGRCFNYPVGSLWEQPLSEVWNSARFTQFRRTLKGAGGTLPACARCCGVIGK